MDTREGTFEFFLESLCLPGQSIDPNQLSSALELLISLQMLLNPLYPYFLSAHLLPFKTSWNSHQRKFSRHSAGKDECPHPARERPMHPCVVLLQLLTEGGMLLWQWHWAAAAPLKAHLEASQGELKQRPVTTQLHRKSRSICNMAILKLM